MSNDNFKSLWWFLAALGRIKFFLLGLLVDALLGCAFFVYLWKWQMRIECWGACTAAEYLMNIRFILWIEVLWIFGLWPISIPLLATPPSFGLRADIRRHEARG